MSDSGDLPPAVTAPVDPRRESRASALVGQNIGSYRVTDVLGSGGMGVVYEAEQQHPRRLVALKVVRGGVFIDDNDVRLFQREAQALARLKHPGIAAIYEAGKTDDGQHFFAMELVPGPTLDVFVKNRFPHPRRPVSQTRQLCEMFLEICDAMAYAHARGVIHRDLKPSNVIVSDETPRILDFGLARIIDADVLGSSIATEPGRIYGTLPYMSPEQVRGNPDDIDVRTDVYSLGVMLYELLAGELPYDVRRATFWDAARTICEQPPGEQALRPLDGDLQTVIRKALEKDAAERYQTVAALRDDLSRYLNDFPIFAKPPSAIDQMRKLVRRHTLAFGAAAAFVVMLAAFASAMTFQARRLVVERDRANREAAAANQITAFLKQLFAVSDPGEARGNTVTAREILDRGAQRITFELKTQPDLQAQLMGVMGTVYQSLGLYADSARLLQSAIAARQESKHTADAAFAENLNQLGGALGAGGDYPQAEAKMAEALRLRRSLFRAADPSIAESLNDLGTIKYAKEDFAAAEQLFKDALAIRTQAFGRRDERTMETLNNLAMTVAQARADYAAESVMLEDVVAFKRARAGGADPGLAQAINNLGMARYRLQQYDVAETLLLEALAMNRRLVGNDHPEVSANLNNIGLLRRDKKDWTGAEAAFNESLAIVRGRVGADHPDAISTLINLSSVKLARGDFAGAEAGFRQAIASQRKTLNESDVQVVTTEGLLGASLTGAGRFAEAEQLLLPAYHIIADRFGASHLRSRAMAKRLTALYDAWHKPDRAEKFRGLQ
jgi:tetratricopeptide (TPR) repeat protein/predicted Ser/Thr protein kinase